MRYIYNTKPEGKENKKDKSNSTTNSRINSKSKSTVRSIEDEGTFTTLYELLDEEAKEGEDEDDEQKIKNKNAKKKNILNTKRPIIFICNDAYSRSLKDLRSKALIYHFQKVESNKLMKRLIEICKEEVI